MITKKYLKTWEIKGYYKYKIFEIDAGGETWLEANPITKGVTRTAENEKILRILLQNDAMRMNKMFNQSRMK